MVGKLDQLRGNEIAIKAFKARSRSRWRNTAALHWNRVPSEDNNKVLDGAFPGAQSFVVDSAVNVQFMVKDSKKYAATCGWTFADFKDGKPGDEGLRQACFSCHQPAKAHDFVYRVGLLLRCMSPAVARLGPTRMGSVRLLCPGYFRSRLSGNGLGVITARLIPIGRDVRLALGDRGAIDGHAAQGHIFNLHADHIAFVHFTNV